MGLLTVAVRFRYVTPLLLAALFLAFSTDEAASTHERIGHRLADQVLPGLNMDRKDAFLWPLLFGIPAAAAIGVMFWRLTREHYLSVHTWLRYAIALAVMFAGAIGFEIIAFNPVWAVPRPSRLYDLLAIGEETLEHIGSSLLAWASFAAFMERRQDTREWLGADHHA